jgi:hypothetical protein
MAVMLEVFGGSDLGLGDYSWGLMSNRARRMLAIVVCVVIGVIAMFESIRRVNVEPLVGGLLVVVALFFLLSAVGLARPWMGGSVRRGPRHR